MKKIAIAFLLLGGCAGSGNDSIRTQIDAAQARIDSAKGLLENVYKIKREDSIAYEMYERDGIGSDHSWNHPDTVQSWIDKDSALYKKWSMVKDSLVTELNKSGAPKP